MGHIRCIPAYRECVESIQRSRHPAIQSNKNNSNNAAIKNGMITKGKFKLSSTQIAP